MKHLLRYISLFLLLFTIPAAAGCADKTLECPFTTAAWDSTLEDIKSLEEKSWNPTIPHITEQLMHFQKNITSWREPLNTVLTTKKS